MGYQKSPYKENKVSISKVLGWDKVSRKDPKKEKSKLKTIKENAKRP